MLWCNNSLEMQWCNFVVQLFRDAVVQQQLIRDTVVQQQLFRDTVVQ